MKRHLFSAACASVLSLTCVCGPAVSEENELVTIVPETTDAILTNPGMGWETFHHTAKDDVNLPDWIPSTLHYARWGWGQIEPKPGQIDYSFLDGVLKDSHDAGQQLAFRMMCCSTSPRNPYHPAWLADIGGRVIQVKRRDGPAVEIPDLDDAETLAAHLDCIERLGQRYDGHPDLDHIDLGSVGWWGEWHLSGAIDAKMPSMETQKKIVDAYLAAFRKTPVLMLIGGGEMLEYAVQRGAGWRADCLGDMGGFSKNWCHMRMAYPEMLPKAKAMDAWKTSPVAWETCWDIRKWVDEGWSLRFVFNYALALHGSCINNKSAPLPAGKEVEAEVRRFLQRLGYRLELKELKHPQHAQSGGSIKLQMKWRNAGSAPCYRPYRLAYRITDQTGFQTVILSNVAVNCWQPGTMDLFTDDFFKQPKDLPPGDVVDVEDQISLPQELSPGRVSLAIAVVDARSGQPAVQLGIKGDDGQRWYPLSTIIVRR